MWLSLLLMSSPVRAEEASEAPAARQPRVFTLVMPLGVPQYVLRRPKLGAAFTGTQVAGFGFGAFASVRMWQAFEAEQYEAERSWRMASWGGIAAGAASYMGSVMHGSRLYQLQGEEMAASARAWQTQRALAELR